MRKKIRKIANKPKILACALALVIGITSLNFNTTNKKNQIMNSEITTSRIKSEQFHSDELATILGYESDLGDLKHLIVYSQGQKINDIELSEKFELLPTESIYKVSGKIYEIKKYDSELFKTAVENSDISLIRENIKEEPIGEREKYMVFNEDIQTLGLPYLHSIVQTEEKNDKSEYPVAFMPPKKDDYEHKLLLEKKYKKRM